MYSTYLTLIRLRFKYRSDRGPSFNLIKQLLLGSLNLDSGSALCPVLHLVTTIPSLQLTYIFPKILFVFT